MRKDLFTLRKPTQLFATLKVGHRLDDHYPMAPKRATVSGIQIIRDNTPGGFSVRATLYGEADQKIADRATSCVQREKRRHFHLTE